MLCPGLCVSCTQGLWLRKIFPGVIFANINVPEKWFRIFSFQNEVTELPDDSTQIFRSKYLVVLYILEKNTLSDLMIQDKYLGQNI